MTGTNLSLGSYLHQLRQERGVALTTLARSAQISRSSVHNWEAQRNLPRMPELAALLQALQASEKETRQALSLMDAPRAKKRIAEAETSHSSLGLPHTGDLLRMLRRRRGWNQARTAAEVGVSQPSVARWERGEIWPGQELLHTLCLRLRAHPAERRALITGLLPLDGTAVEEGKPVGLDLLEARLSAVRTRLREPRYNALGDLYYLSLEANAVPIARQRPEGRLFLARLLLDYAEYLGGRCQAVDAGRVAERAQELLPRSGDRWNSLFLKSEIFWAVGKYPLQEHAALLKHWMERPLPFLDRSWVMGQIGSSLGDAGNMEAALTIRENGILLAQQEGNAESVQHQRNAYAETLLSAGRAAEATEFFSLTSVMTPPSQLRIKLNLAEAHLGAGNRSRAHDWLHESYTDNAAIEIDYYTPQMASLARRL